MIFQQTVTFFKTELKMADYKQLALALYDALRELRCLIDDENIPKWSNTMSHVDSLIQRYEDEVVRGTGRTTALYIKCIAESLANPGVQIEFQDHYRHTWGIRAKDHTINLRDIIKKLEYDIDVTAIGTQVFLYNRFGK